MPKKYTQGNEKTPEFVKGMLSVMEKVIEKNPTFKPELLIAQCYDILTANGFNDIDIHFEYNTRLFYAQKRNN